MRRQWSGIVAGVVVLNAAIPFVAVGTPTPTPQSAFCAYYTFPLAASADDAYAYKSDGTASWPPNSVVTFSSTGLNSNPTKDFSSGQTSRSLSFERYDTSSLPDDLIVLRADREVVLTGGHTDTTGQSRTVDVSWANAAAANGWSGADYADTLPNDAVSGGVAIGSLPATGVYRWQLSNPSSVSRTSWTGLISTPSGAQPPNGTTAQYWFAAYDHPFGPPGSGDFRPKLIVYGCVPTPTPTPTATVTPTRTATPLKFKTWIPVDLQDTELGVRHTGSDAGICCEYWQWFGAPNCKVPKEYCTLNSDCAGHSPYTRCMPPGVCSGTFATCNIGSDCPSGTCGGRSVRWDSGITPDSPQSGDLGWTWSFSATLDTWDGMHWDGAANSALRYDSTNVGCDPADGTNCISVISFSPAGSDRPTYLLNEWRVGETLNRNGQSAISITVDNGVAGCVRVGGCDCSGTVTWSMKMEPWDSAADPPKDNPKVDAAQPMVRMSQWQRTNWTTKNVGGTYDCGDGDFFEQWWFGYGTDGAGEVIAHARGWHLAAPNTPIGTSPTPTPKRTPPAGAWPTPPWDFNLYFAGKESFTPTPTP